jgi:hypothetical protein
MHGPSGAKPEAGPNRRRDLDRGADGAGPPALWPAGDWKSLLRGPAGGCKPKIGVLYNFSGLWHTAFSSGKPDSRLLSTFEFLKMSAQWPRKKTLY